MVLVNLAVKIREQHFTPAKSLFIVKSVECSLNLRIPRDGAVFCYPQGQTHLRHQCQSIYVPEITYVNMVKTK